MTGQRTAIVTGAGKRVGREIAAALVEDGWSVIAQVHHADDQVPPGATKVVADLEDADCAEKIFAAADGLPPVRLLVNNAARFAWDAFGEFGAQEFAAHMAVNVRAPMLLIDRFASLQDNGQDSLIVNLLDSKLASPNPDYLSYTLSKQALAGLTELAARALAEDGIRVNGIAPGLVDTKMTKVTTANPKRLEGALERIPLKRLGTPEDMAGAALFLASPLSSYIVGQTIIVDGGLIL